MLDTVPSSRVLDARGAGGAESARGLQPLVARALLLAAAPVSMIWLPVAELPGAGTVSVTDAVLIALWGITAADVVVRGISTQDVDTPLIVVLALCIGVLAALASELGPLPGKGVLEFLTFMKRFGLAAILPLAAFRFRSASMRTWTRLMTIPTMATFVVFTLWPDLRHALPMAENYDLSEMGDRATGPLTNPNDLAYAAVALTMLHGALVGRGSGLLARGLFVATAAGGATCLVASGSRSALVGTGAAVALMLVRSGLGRWARLSLVAGVIGLVSLGISSSEVFSSRVESIYEMGASEESFAARVEMQSMMVRTWLEYPLGVGYRAFVAAAGNDRKSYFRGTSDSVYFDTLLGAGVFGLLALLFLLRTAWRVAEVGPGGPANEGVLQAGLVAFMVFGTATVIPISVHLAPLFFTVVAAGVYARSGR